MKRHPDSELRSPKSPGHVAQIKYGRIGFQGHSRQITIHPIFSLTDGRETELAQPALVHYNLTK